MDTIAYHQTHFNNRLAANIITYKNLSHTEEYKLVERLGLTVQEFQNRILGKQGFTAWEVNECAQVFGCMYELLLPETVEIKADLLWSIARGLPSNQIEILLKKSIELITNGNVVSLR